MESRERVIRALTFGSPDRIPVSFGALPAAYMRYGHEIDELLCKYPIDIAHREWDPDSIDPRFIPGVYEDDWGCVWKCSDAGYMGQVMKHPLGDYRALDTWKPPFESLPKEIRKVTDRNPEPGKFWLEIGGQMFHHMCWLRGTENVMIDIMDADPNVYRLRDMLLDYYAMEARFLCKSDIDGVRIEDDFGSQTQLLMSPAAWRSFIKPAYDEVVGICKEAGKFVQFHSDGYIMEILDDLIEMGVDAINAQVWCMGPELLGRKFAGKVTFWGEICRQSTITHGTPEDIYACTRTMKEHLMTDTGGLVGHVEIDGLTPFENIEALLTAWN